MVRINVVFYREHPTEMLTLCSELQEAGFKPAGAELDSATKARVFEEIREIKEGPPGGNVPSTKQPPG